MIVAEYDEKNLFIVRAEDVLWVKLPKDPASELPAEVYLVGRKKPIICGAAWGAHIVRQIQGIEPIEPADPDKLREEPATTAGKS